MTNFGDQVSKTQVHNKKFLFLKIGESTFSVPLSRVREVLGLGQISPLPNMPPYLAGLINLRGKIVSAIHLRKSLNFLNVAEASTKRPCVIIIDVSGQLYGAIVDDVIAVQAVSSDDIEYSIEGMNNKEVFEGIIKQNKEDLAPILNLEKALKISELMSVKQKLAA